MSIDRKEVPCRTIQSRYFSLMTTNRFVKFSVSFSPKLGIAFARHQMALQRCRNSARIPDIILSDLNMPLMSGFELLSIVRQRFPLTRVVAMSGAFSGEAIPTGVSADAFYEKGSNPKSLLSWLDAMADPRTDTFTPTSASTQVLWIATVGHDTTGTAYVLLACPECLRAFPDVVTEAIETVRRTRCAHCLEAINYAIVRAEMPLLQTSLARGTESSRERASARH
jgi:CheY-like chemotaxis protein